MKTPDQKAQSTAKNCEERIYQNAGNKALISLLDIKCSNVLDVGCGGGDNAKLAQATGRNIYGITLSSAEANIAKNFMKQCWTSDIEIDIQEEISSLRFDALIFSHVLEHVRDPADVLARYLILLEDGGTVLIAVPNILSWRYRLLFLFGRFEYESTGTLDETHLRFFTFDSSDKFILRLAPELKVISKTVEGSVPLWFLRRYVLPASISLFIDNLGCKYFPNLFGGQILIKAVKSNII